MGSANCIEGGVDTGTAGTACGQAPHRSNEVAGSIVNRLRAESVDYRHVFGGTRTEGLQTKMAGQIEQRRADGSRGAYHEYRRTPRNGTAARQHLKRRNIGQRHAHRFGRIDAIGNRHEEPRGTDRILGIATDYAQIGDHFTLRRRGYARADLVYDTNDLIARRKRQRSLEVRISSTPDHGVGKSGTSRNYPDADLPRSRHRDR